VTLGVKDISPFQRRFHPLLFQLPKLKTVLPAADAASKRVLVREKTPELEAFVEE
jgi:hypothetical protein